MIAPKNGTFLIADPFLKDPNFQRTVIFLCEHNKESSFGLVINRILPLRLSDLLTNLSGANFPIYYGGPVETNTLHFLHRIPDLIPGSQQLQKNIFWGGEMDALNQLILQDKLKKEDIRFYLGYSGWGETQLDGEIKENTWITGKGNAELIFMPNPEKCWHKSLHTLGEPFSQMALYPLDPQLN
jgi:putative transcriptional regulator